MTFPFLGLPLRNDWDNTTEDHDDAAAAQAHVYAQQQANRYAPNAATGVIRDRHGLESDGSESEENNNNNNNNAAGGVKEEDEEDDELLSSGEYLKFTGPHFSLPGNRLRKAHGYSVWWRVFHKFNLDHPDNEQYLGSHYACCNMCGKVVNMGKDQSTSALRQHVRGCNFPVHEELMAVYNQRKRQSGKGSCRLGPREKSTKKRKAEETGEESFGVKGELGPNLNFSPAPRTLLTGTTTAAVATPTGRLTKAEVMDQQEIALAKWMVSSNLPVVCVSDPNFGKVIDSVVSAGRRALRYFPVSYMMERIHSIEANLRAFLKHTFTKDRKAVLTFDRCSSRNNHSSSSDNNNTSSSSRSQLLLPGQQQQGITALTIHWIQNFELQHATLAVQVNNHHSGIGSQETNEMIAQIQQECEAWELSVDNVPFIVTDRSVVAGNNHNTADFSQLLREKLQLQSIDCIDSVLEQIASIIFRPEFYGDDLGQDQSPVLTKARLIVDLFHHSSDKISELHKQQQQLDDIWAAAEQEDDPPQQQQQKIVTEVPSFYRDVVGRWWSTFRMVDRLCRYREALSAMAEHGKLKPEYQLSLEEWSSLKQIRYLLQPFKSAIVYLDGTNYVTVSLVLPICRIIRDCLQTIVTAADDSDDTADEDDEKGNDDGSTNSEATLSHHATVQECAAAMLQAFDARFGDLDRPFVPPEAAAPFESEGENNRKKRIHWAVLIGHALDPRFKDLHYINSASTKLALWDHILQRMSDVKLEQTPQSGTKRKNKKKKSSSNYDPLTASLMAYDNRNTADNTSGGGGSSKGRGGSTATGGGVDEEAVASCKTELRLYHAAGRLAHFRGKSLTQQNNPLEWWQENQTRFPRLWKLAEQFLAIPAISCPAERAFQTTTNDRFTHNPETLLLRENRQFLNNME